MGTGAFILAALKVLPLLLRLFSQFKSAADEKVQRGLGYDQAVKEALEEGSRRLVIAKEAAEIAEKEHAAHPNDDSGFLNEFARKD